MPLFAAVYYSGFPVAARLGIKPKQRNKKFFLALLPAPKITF
jgi:hypothetical protein